MKIICLIDSLGSGGAQRQLVGLAALLEEKQYDVKIVWYHDINFYQPLLESCNINYSNIAVKGRWAKLIHVSSEIKKYNPDIVVAYIDGPTIIACLLRMLGAKFRLVVSERNTTQVRDWKERFKFFVYRWSDAIVSNSYSQEQFIKKYYPNLSAKVHVITNFTDTVFFSPNIEPNKRAFPMRMLVVGRIVEQKNVYRFMHALKVVKNAGYSIKVDWYGEPFYKEYYSECLFERKTLGLEDVIQFCQESLDIRDVYRSADVFCLPSLFEGYPNVICEAMSCGIPVLCSDVCDNSKIIDEGKNGFLFNPLSIEDIADKIMKFMQLSDNLRVKMGYHSRNIAVVKFSKDIFVAKYQLLFSNILNLDRD